MDKTEVDIELASKYHPTFEKWHYCGNESKGNNFSFTFLGGMLGGNQNVKKGKAEETMSS